MGQACEGEAQGHGRHCTVDTSGFNVDQPTGTVSQIDLGDGNSLSCRSTSTGADAALHAECVVIQTGVSLQNEEEGKGQMNAIVVEDSDGNKQLHASVTANGNVCNIHPNATGSSVMECIPTDEFPPEEDPHNDEEEEIMVTLPGYGGRSRELVSAPVDDQKQLPLSSAVGLRGGHRGLADDGSVLDIMVVWTNLAECANSGLSAGCTHDATTESNIRGRIALAIAETNTAYTGSGVTTKLRLVHAYREDNYVEASADAFSAALNAITGKSDGVMDDVHAKRDKYGADIVALIIHDSQYCGVAWLGPSEDRMFSITAWNCATGYYSFAHEIGHNMGCNHDKGTTNACSGTNSQYGYRDPNAEFRSIMAYTCASGQCDNNKGGGCTRVQMFSNPNINYNNKPIGSALHDNAGRINSVKATIAGYRNTIPVCSVNSDCDDNDPCTTNVCDGICKTEPINCNDNNACTNDTCSGGQCSNTPISCDDGNPCTEDSCSLDGGCINTPIASCCGNDVCEAGENTDNCNADCAVGPFTIEGPSCRSLGLPCYIRDGHMFDVKAQGRDVSVTSMNIHYYKGGTAQVWTRSGTHVGHRSSDGWTKVAEHDFTGTSPWAMATFPDFAVSVHITAGSTQAFYVTLNAGGDQLYHKGNQSTSAIAAQDKHLIMYEGYTMNADFVTSGNLIRVWNGQIVYKTGGAGAPHTLGPSPIPTKATTSPPVPTVIPTPAPVLPPTPAPALPPTMPPTVIPTPAPTIPPTMSPTVIPTPAPTLPPTMSPTPLPTTSPSKLPTGSPTISSKPTRFVPEVIDMVKDTGSATVLRGAYFEVKAGDTWAKITNLKVVTYRAQLLEVYYKYGSAAPYEKTPCAWKKIAETDSSWNPGYWKRVFPPWVNGFEPVVLPANETVSFYVAVADISTQTRGILGFYDRSSKDYSKPFMALNALSSPVGAIAMSSGKGGEQGQRFKPKPSYYYSYGMYGGLRLESMQPGSTSSPTQAPTMPTTSDSIKSSFSGANSTQGLQFEVENLLQTEDIIVTNFNILFTQAGNHHVEVWHRNGSYKGSSSSTCKNWNNWCKEWIKVYTSTDYYGTSGGSTKSFVAVARAGTTSSFAIVSGTSMLSINTAETSGDISVKNGHLEVHLASLIKDYHGENLQTSHALSSSEIKFEGGIGYKIAHSVCAVHSLAPWVVMNPDAANAFESDEVADVDEEIITNVEEGNDLEANIE